MLYSQSKIKCDLIEVSSIAFNKNPTIKSANFSIQNAEGNFQVQKSVFDFKLNSEVGYQNEKYNLFDADSRNKYLDKVLKNNSFYVSAGLEKTLRTGQIVDVSLKYNYNNNNYPYNSFAQYVGAYYGNHNSTVNLTLTQPLLRGRGKKVATASEEAAVFYINKSKYEYEFSNSYQIQQIGTVSYTHLRAHETRIGISFEN